MLDPAALAALSPGETVNVPFELCNVGTAAGTVTAVTHARARRATCSTAAGAELTATVTSPAVGDGASLRPDVRDTRRRDARRSSRRPRSRLPRRDTTGTITFTVTGTSD